MSGLIVEELTFAYPGQVPVLTDLTLAVEPGEVMCLLGANGAGKSTLLACVLGFLVPKGGRILVAGVNVQEDAKKAREKLAYVPESVALWGFLTGREHVKLFAELTGTRVDVGAVLERVGLPSEAWSKRVSGYSKGMRQKLALALATLRRPAVALFDEPTSGLDPESAQAMVGLLRSLAEEGVAVLVVTHDIWLVAQAASRFGVLRGGRLVHEGPPQERSLLAGLFA
jgi:ABC-2 type transport system ATP-binding protein